MIARSDGAKYAKHVFFTAFNDLDVFIEDTAVESKKMYAEIIRRALGGDVSISQVFPIGSKNKVIDQCSKNQGVRTRKAVFLIDGDFDVLSGSSIPSLKRLYRLKRYCIENYLIDESSLLSILDEELHSKDVAIIKAELNFDGWRKIIADDLAPLVLSSCVGLNRACGLPAVNYPLSDICSCTTGFVDVNKIASKVVAFKAATDLKHGAGVFDSDFTSIEASAPASKTDLVFFHASGKALLLPLLKKRLMTLFGYAPSAIPFKLRIAMRCNVAELKDIAAVIE